MRAGGARAEAVVDRDPHVSRGAHRGNFGAAAIVGEELVTHVEVAHHGGIDAKKTRVTLNLKDPKYKEWMETFKPEKSIIGGPNHIPYSFVTLITTRPKTSFGH